MNAIEFSNRANELFAVPNTANELRMLFSRDDSTMNDIARVVSGDPGLAVHLLKYANSPLYRFERKIESLEKAIQVIGATAVYEFALTFGISQMLSREHYEFINVSRFWKQSILCGLYAAYFARKCKEKDIARLYTGGLLHNIGELAVLRVTPTLALDCGTLKAGILPKQTQENILGFSYAEVSASLLQQWLIPDALVSIVAMQHHDDAPAVTIESQLMQLAYSLAIVKTYPELYCAKLHIPEFLYTSLQLDADVLEQAVHDNQEQYLSLATIFKM